MGGREQETGTTVAGSPFGNETLNIIYWRRILLLCIVCAFFLLGTAGGGLNAVLVMY